MFPALLTPQQPRLLTYQALIVEVFHDPMAMIRVALLGDYDGPSNVSQKVLLAAGSAVLLSCSTFTSYWTFNRGECDLLVELTVVLQGEDEIIIAVKSLESPAAAAQPPARNAKC